MDQYDRQLQIMRQYQRRRSQHWYGNILILILGVILLVLTTAPNRVLDLPAWMVSVAAIGLIVANRGFNYLHWRCPKCNGSLGRFSDDPRHCPGCGARLR